LKRHHDDRTIIFTANNDFAYDISREFIVPCITHQTKTDERTEILDRFRSGEYSMLVTSQVLDEGIDVPAANVGIILSGSASKRQYAQRLGRILRPTDDRQPARLYEIITEDTMETYVSQRRREGWVPVLTADLARSRTTDETITPLFIDPDEERYQQTARELIQLFEAHLGEPKGDLEDAIDELTIADTDYKIVQGLAKLLKDECEFEVVASVEPRERSAGDSSRKPTSAIRSSASRRWARTHRSWRCTARSPTTSGCRWKSAIAGCTPISKTTNDSSESERGRPTSTPVMTIRRRRRPT